MKKLYALLFGVILFSVAARSQYVNIPDTSFRRYLNDKHPACFNSAGQLDTLCAAAASDTDFNFGSYQDITTYSMTNIDGIQYFKNLKYFSIYQPLVSISVIPKFPPHLIHIYIVGNRSLHTIPAIPDSVDDMQIEGNALTSLPPLPSKLLSIECTQNLLTSLPPLPSGLGYLNCVDNQLTRLPQLPPALYTLACDNNKLDSLPALPSLIRGLSCASNKIKSLPTLPDSLKTLSCSSNMLLTSLPQLPSRLTTLKIYSTSITCLPVLPATLSTLYLDTSVTRCIPNTNNSLIVSQAWGSGSAQNNIIYNPRLCNVTNNANGCIVFPFVSGRLFYDINSNGTRELNEPYNPFAKIQLSNGRYTFTNDSGYYEVQADTLGTLTITPASTFFNISPASKTCTFSRYDTAVIQNFAYQPTTQITSVGISNTSNQWRVRPGNPLDYYVAYANTGSSNLGATTIQFIYDSSKITFKSVNNASVTQSGNILTLNLSSFPIQSHGRLYISFTVKTTASIGDVIKSLVTITSGAYIASDSTINVVSTSIDPNDKDATPVLTPQQINTGKFIDYVIRFQNTGNAAAIHVVIADTLSSQLQANTLEMVSTSHQCKATVKGNTVSFEMRNIMLPDSNVNEAMSHGFIRFRVKPLNTLVAGNTVPNKAAIYFDYNTPVITNTAVTTISNSGTFPLKLLTFRGNMNDKKDVALYWKTANEINVSRFEIQRSVDARIFSPVGNVTANNTHESTYQFSDNATQNSPLQGAAGLFYRLKMLDRDGAFIYSPVIFIKNILGNNAFEIAANPVTTTLLLTGINAALLNSEATLVNSVGVVVKHFTLKTNTQAVDMSNLPAGLYVVHTQMGSEKVVVNRK